ncbi:50S ribosomal protein L6 [Patescibacteria group bacterium]|nr:50S ribosomal protein L6 [Patescibacteria group bacterium]
MSKIGKQPIDIKEGVNISIENGQITASGVKGSLSFEIPKGIGVKIEEGKILVLPKDKNDKEIRAMFGLTRARIANIVKGASEGFEKKLELSGVGYRAQASGNQLTLSLGFSHPVVIKAPEGVLFAVAENTITVSGIDKVLVGNTAAQVRAAKPPEPYKGKGIKYKNEKIRRKAGKAAKAVGAK